MTEIARPSRSPFRRIAAIVAPHRIRLALAMVLVVIGAGVGLFYPQALRWLIDRGIADGEVRVVDSIGLMLLAVVVAQAGIVWLRHYELAWIGERVVSDLRRRIYGHVLRQAPSWFHAQRTGELVGRLATDVTIVEHVVSTELGAALRNTLQLAGGVALLFVAHAKLAAWMLLAVPPLVVAVVAFGRRVVRMVRDVHDGLADASGRVQEALGAITVVQAFVREEHEAARYGEGVERALRASLRVARWRATFFATAVLVGLTGIGTLVWAGGREVVAGRMTPGDLAAFLLYTMMVASSVANLATLFASLQRAAGATERLFDVLETEPAIRTPGSPVPLPDGGGRIAFEGVSFEYPTRSGDAALREVDLVVEPGEVVAIVGPSGAGKTTLTGLLPRFFDPTRGVVRFEGEDVRTLDLDALRKAIAMVPQEPVLFSGSIRENIAYGVDGASDAEIEAAARTAHVDEFVERLADGYETRVGERGVQLSAGQRQRVAIARAILANPRVLVLDEATSNLDAQSEALVKAAVEASMRGRTTLVIAHRLSTVRHADRIVVLELGHIVDQGTHERLLAGDGLYKDLVEHQLVS